MRRRRLEMLVARALGIIMIHVAERGQLSELEREWVLDAGKAIKDLRGYTDELVSERREQRSHPRL